LTSCYISKIRRFPSSLELLVGVQSDSRIIGIKEIGILGETTRHPQHLYHHRKAHASKSRTGFETTTSVLEWPKPVPTLQDAGKGKVVPVLSTEHHSMKAYWGGEGIAPRIHDLGTR